MGEAGLPSLFTIHSFRERGSPTRFLAGTAVDEIMKIGGWKTESIAKYCIVGTSSDRVRGGKRKRGQSYADASRLPLSPELKTKSQCLRERVEARVRKIGRYNYVSDQWLIKVTKYYPTTQRSMGETTGRRRRPHPKSNTYIK